ncbi:MAG: hypothetical protein GXP26_02955 [Planctomycetes bacterium]|nr:hypothetical protein [Planctomycetota bacterium]
MKFYSLHILFGCLFLACLGCGASTADLPEAETAEVTAEPPATTPREEPANSQAELQTAEAGPPSAAEAENPEAEQPDEEEGEEYVEPPRLPPPVGATAMPEPNRVWVDLQKKLVFVDGYISLQEGMLEMFACPAGTKEHESIVAVYSSAQVVHAALLAVGAEVGTPVQFNPEFKPPTGTEIAVEVRWQDKAGEWQSIEAQQWITDIKTGKPMDHPWVFAGSGFYKDEETGEKYYMAEGGELICVSNFSTATLDIPAESSQVNDGLLFEANAAKIPPLGTPVRLVLTPKLESQEEK